MKTIETNYFKVKLRNNVFDRLNLLYSKFVNVINNLG